MPKRPCAVTLTPDESTLLCADKFGDVYALPLLGHTYESSALDQGEGQKDVGNIQANVPDPFMPSASSLTVHTKRNRDALRQQQNMIKKKSEKKPVNFDHRLILGHVSLLTDVICASVQSDTGISRTYILTADRDEHIRVSRGLPQAHVIEGYCLGHRQFISKLCLVPSHPQLLFSGGGDDFLLLWDWPAGQVKYQIDLKAQVEDFCRSTTVASKIHQGESIDLSADRIAVSTIHCLTIEGSGNNGNNIDIVVSVEGYPAVPADIVSYSLTVTRIPALFLFDFIISTGNVRLEKSEIYRAEGNIIDVAILPDQKVVFYSTDCIHNPFSTTDPAADADQDIRPCVGAIDYSAQGSGLITTSILYKDLVLTMDTCAKSQTLVEQRNAAKGKSLKEMLYGLESLRKRGGEDLEE